MRVLTCRAAVERCGVTSQYADEAVAELAERGAVADASGPELVAPGAGAW